MLTYKNKRRLHKYKEVYYMSTWKKRLCETAVVVGCLVGIIVIGASGDRQQMAAEEGINSVQQEYVLSDAN